MFSSLTWTLPSSTLHIPKSLNLTAHSSVPSPYPLSLWSHCRSSGKAFLRSCPCFYLTNCSKGFSLISTPGKVLEIALTKSLGSAMVTKSIAFLSLWAICNIMTTLIPSAPPGSTYMPILALVPPLLIPLLLVVLRVYPVWVSDISISNTNTQKKQFKWGMACFGSWFQANHLTLLLLDIFR